MCGNLFITEYNLHPTIGNYLTRWKQVFVYPTLPEFRFREK